MSGVSRGRHARGLALCAIAVTTAVAVGGATGDTPAGTVPTSVRAGMQQPDDLHPVAAGRSDPVIAASVRAALLRIRAHEPLPERAPSRIPRHAGRSPSAVAEHDAHSGIPVIALQAYRDAAREIDAGLPGCRLDWWILAGIGRIESDHGRYGGAVTDARGDITPAILGPRLTGRHGTARIADTDHGRYDGDRGLDRAVGPMQFLPGTWAIVGADGNGDGTADPNNIYDAALGAAGYLCAGGRDLHRPADLRAAIFSYNHSGAYVEEVLSLAALYRQGRVPTVPDSAGPGADAFTSARGAAPQRWHSGSGSDSGAAPDRSGVGSHSTNGLVHAAGSRGQRPPGSGQGPAGRAPTAPAGHQPPSGRKAPEAPTSTKQPITPAGGTASRTPPPAGGTSRSPTSPPAGTTAPPTTAPRTTDPPTSPPPTTTTPPRTTDPPTSPPPTTTPTTTPTSPQSTTPTPPPGTTPTRPPCTAPEGRTPPARPTITRGAADDPLVATTTRPTFSTQVQGSHERLLYRFQLAIRDGDQDRVIGGCGYPAGPGGAARWTPRAGLLEPGQAYSIRAMATGLRGVSEWSPWLDFAVAPQSGATAPATSPGTASASSAGPSTSDPSPTSDPSASPAPAGP